jgi:hypothetical protein
MKKLFFAILSFGVFTANAQTAEEIVQKYSANLGGLEAFNKLKTAKMTGTFSTQGADMTLTSQIVNGKAARTEVEYMGNKVIRVYNNGKGWIQNPFAGVATPKEATAEELIDLKPQSMLSTILMDYKARGHKIELAGQEDVEGVKTFKIKLTNKDDGKVTNYYIKTDDYVMVKSDTEREIQGQNVKIETLFSNLKEVNGLKFFMERTQKIDGETFQTTTFDKIELDVPIDEKIFNM